MTPPGAPQRPVPRGALLALRATSTLLAVLTLAQATFAGSFLTGRYEMLMVHSTNAMVLAALALGQFLFGAALRLLGYGPLWLVVRPLLVAVAIGAQIALGFSRVLGVHVTLGVAISISVAFLSTAVWQTPLPPRADRARNVEPAGAAS
ncbi:hypothetical protein [Kitasatospora sp. NPDC101183]|uniref:hypothetical protein n=1 Tax=Kitasatospora sp. NPDC101183 TaxID=3364100 RepID=UPI0038131F49